MARPSHRAPTVAINERHDLFVDLATEHHFDDVHGFIVGDPHTLDETALFANLFQQFPDLRTTPVYDNRVHPDLFEQYDILREAALQVFIHHRVAAKLDDHGLLIQRLDIGQGLDQNFSYAALVNFH